MGAFYQSRAPLRLGFGGGGTDIPPYCDEFGGCVLNATIDLFSYCSISPRNDNQVFFSTKDSSISCITSSEKALPLEGDFIFHKATYNRVVREFNQGRPLPCNITTYSDAPIGSGLGTSSTMVVAILGAFKEWLHLPLRKDEIAHLAFEIERIELGFAGGKQDQYSAAFGGINFINFFREGKVVVNQLTIEKSILNKLQDSLLLYYTGASRDSSVIIKEQVNNVKIKARDPVLAMHALKKNAIKMKQYLLTGDLGSFAEGLAQSWEVKKKMASTISNNNIDSIFGIARKAGALSGKISGAGGGGYIVFMVDPSQRIEVEKALQQLEGNIQRFHFVPEGVTSWKNTAFNEIKAGLN